MVKDEIRKMWEKSSRGLFQESSQYLHLGKEKQHEKLLRISPLGQNSKEKPPEYEGGVQNL
jgi:hypothetical protein